MWGCELTDLCAAAPLGKVALSDSLTDPIHLLLVPGGRNMKVNTYIICPITKKKEEKNM